MAELIPVFKSSIGLNNKADPVRLSSKPEAVELPESINIDIDDTGRPERRDGFTATAITSASHSIFCDGGECLFIQGTALYRLNADYSVTGVRSGLTSGARMSYAQVGERIYYTNAFELGYVINGISYAWAVGAYVGPTTTKTFSSPPIGNLLALYNGRMYIFQDGIVWYSEPFNYGAYNLATNFIPFTDTGTLLMPVDTGLVISTTKAIYTLTGASPAEFVLRKVADYPVIKGTGTKIEASRLGLEGKLQGSAIMFTSKNGICLVGSDGMFLNLTERKLDYPNSVFGASLYKDGKYISLLRP